MNTLQFYKEQVAIKYGYADWEQLQTINLASDDIPVYTELFAEAAEVYTEEACKKQRELCSEALHFTLREPVREYIENAPLAVSHDTTKQN